MPDTDFAQGLEGYRRELLAHCYRMVGSVDEAEDLVQETYLRAWRAQDGFEGRASLRTWLYRIATNVCLTALQSRGRRMLPSGLGAPSTDPLAEPAVAGADVEWLQPIPDALVTPSSADPAEIVGQRDSLRLALIASLQYLPPRQRAVLILREVLAWKATEVAEALDMTVAGVKSALQRARARLDEVALTDHAQVTAPPAPQTRALLEQYMKAFENSDAEALEQALRADVTLEFTPATTWFSGMATCMPYFIAQALREPGDWRMVPTSANGQPAAVAYYRGELFGIAVLTVSAAGIARITVFGDPDVARRFIDSP